MNTQYWTRTSWTQRHIATLGFVLMQLVNIPMLYGVVVEGLGMPPLAHLVLAAGLYCFMADSLHKRQWLYVLSFAVGVVSNLFSFYWLLGGA